MNHDLILFICCIGVIVCVPSIIAAAAWARSCNTDTVARGAEIDKQIADLKTAQRRAARVNRRISQKGARLEKRVKQLEKLGEKTDETPIRNTRTSSYDAGINRRSGR